MHILHTEASLGWGGQEIRILREMEGMRSRGHAVSLVTAPGAQLCKRAREKGFPCYEVPFRWGQIMKSYTALKRIIKTHSIEVVNTHSSMDAWIAGLIGKILGCTVVRTRHISAHIKSGLNSRVLYGWLADGVVTTCEQVAEIIRKQAGRDQSTCLSIPTGIDPSKMEITSDAGTKFREGLGIDSADCIVGTACILRSWKGISHLLQAAALLKNEAKLKWLIVGSGPIEELCRKECQELGLNEKVFFTGYLENPFPAIQAFDVFTLLSTGNEGVSQASLQAAFLEKPMVTTRTGGLAEVCRDGVTGFTVECAAPEQIAQAVRKMLESPDLRSQMGLQAKALVMEEFTWNDTLDGMERLYAKARSAASN